MIDLTSNKITIEVNNLEYDGNMWGYMGIYGNMGFNHHSKKGATK
jgi:hypothetical protein